MIEFDCVECGRHIISLGNDFIQRTHPNTCAACFSLPGWFRDPELCRRLDPDMQVKPPKPN